MFDLNFAIDLISFVIPTFIIGMNQDPNLKITKSDFQEAKKIVKENRKLDKEEVNKVIKLNPSDVSDNILDNIRRVSSGVAISEVIYTNYAIKTDKMIKYAYYYMTNDKARLLSNIRKETREFINGITELAGFGKIFKNDAVADIKKFDVIGKDSIESEYIIDYQAIVDQLNDEEFQSKWKARKARMDIQYNPNQIETTKNTANDNIIKPFWFSSQPIVYTPKPKKGIGISDEMFNKLERSFAKFFTVNDDYYYECIDRIYYLVVVRKDAFYAEDRYIVDDGRMLGGNTLSLMGRFITPNGIQDTILIKVDRHPDIIEKVLRNNFYILDPYEVSMCFQSDMFNNGLIYRYIDMSNTPWMDTISFEDRFKLDQNLTRILDKSDIYFKDRYRFDSYIDSDNFSIKTDGALTLTINNDKMAPTTDEDIMVKLENNIIYHYVKGILRAKYDMTTMKQL